MNQFAALFKSRKFLLLLADTFGSLLLYFVVKYANAGVAEDVKVVLLALQPLIGLFILGITPDEVAAKIKRL